MAIDGIATPGKIIAVHLNYPSRAAQRGRTPAAPSYFFKPASSLAATGGTLERPAGTELLAGGFPCQDLSQAGPTRGIRGERSGLVDEAFRLLRTHQLPWLLLENVPFMLQLHRGHALDHIVTALEELGYAWAYRVVDSRSMGLPQRRERVYREDRMYRED